MSNAVDLAVVGNLLLDDIVYADGTTRMGQPGGAALYVALGASLWPVGVGVVSRVGDDYPPELLAELGSRGIDLTGVRPTGGPTMRTWLLYEGRRRRVVHRLGGPTHTDVSPTVEELPESWRLRAIHLAPMPWSVQRDLVGGLTTRSNTLLSADPYELLTEHSFDSWCRLFSRIDLLFLSEDEMTIRGALDSPVPVLEQLGPQNSRRRLASILYKRGALGGLHFDTETGKAREWSSRSGEVLDPTGAGDAFAGGVLAGRLLGETMRRSLDRGVVSASFALEAEGADGLFAATPEAARDRLLEWFDH
ncbi:MAG: carbohydrate kinase family protein [Acidobacteriota bacterium]|nr:carbohydrate kinase family protein [Acidobacteriota bacterium]